MSKFNIKNYIVRIMFFLVGCFIIQLGVAFFIKSNTGVDSFTIFMQGLANLLHITVGQANILVMGIVFIGMLIFTREYIRLGTFLAVITAGPFLDLINNLLNNVGIDALPLIVRLLIVAISCVVIAIGFSILKMGSYHNGRYLHCSWFLFRRSFRTWNNYHNTFNWTMYPILLTNYREKSRKNYSKLIKIIFS